MRFFSTEAGYADHPLTFCGKDAVPMLDAVYQEEELRQRDCTDLTSNRQTVHIASSQRWVYNSIISHHQTRKDTHYMTGTINLPDPSEDAGAGERFAIANYQLAMAESGQVAHYLGYLEEERLFAVSVAARQGIKPTEYTYVQVEQGCLGLDSLMNPTQYRIRDEYMVKLTRRVKQLLWRHPSHIRRGRAGPATGQHPIQLNECIEERSMQQKDLQKNTRGCSCSDWEKTSSTWIVYSYSAMISIRVSLKSGGW